VEVIAEEEVEAREVHAGRGQICRYIRIRRIL